MKVGFKGLYFSWTCFPVVKLKDINSSTADFLSDLVRYDRFSHITAQFIYSSLLTNFIKEKHNIIKITDNGELLNRNTFQLYNI